MLAEAGAVTDPDGLRPYQRRAFDAVMGELARVRSTLLVLPTGGGKTHTFAAVAGHWPGRVLVLAHRSELLDQARRKVAAMTGCSVDLEQGDAKAGTSRIVVASVQTLSRLSRLQRWEPSTFGLVIVDEAHHATAPSYTRILNYFASAKVLGVTATADRCDGLALGKVFESVAFTMGPAAGIAGGWLCRAQSKSVFVDSIDLSHVHTVAGDLNERELDDVLSREPALHGVAKPLLALAGDRKTIVFSGPTRATAKLLADILNRYRPGCAKSVDGTTEAGERAAILGDHDRGEFQFLVNVGIATEGYDSPSVSCIALARPTKSRCLYAQMVGRGLRTSPGKADCLVLGFAGASGHHELAGPVDLLGGEYDEPTRALAKRKLARAPGDVLAALEASKTELEAAATKKLAAVKARVQWRAGGARDLLTAQRAPTDVELAAIARSIDENRRARGLCSFAQERALKGLGVQASNIPAGLANRLMDVARMNRDKLGKWGFLPGELNRLMASVPRPAQQQQQQAAGGVR